MRSPQAEDVLTPLARQYFERAPGAGAPTGAGWRRGAAGSPAASACVVVYLQLDPAGCVQGLRWQAWGCPHVLAVLGWLSEQWVGRPLTSPPGGGPEGWARALGVPIEKLGRLLLIEDALAES